MPTPGQNALTIVETEEVQKIVDAAIKELSFAEEIFDAAKWRIARDWDLGEPIPGSSKGHRIVNFLPAKISESSGLLVRFYFEDVRAIIDFVEFYPYDPRQAALPAAYVLQRGAK